MKGKLIVFEGISGTGKETQAKLLQEYLGKLGITCQIVFHPSAELKAILSEWRKNRNIDHVSEVYFLFADRYNRVQEIINPALARGEWLISLRNSVSALVYQGKTPSECTWIQKEFARFEPTPDVLFFFDMTPEEAMTRIEKRRRETGEPLGYFETKEHLYEKRKKYELVLKTIPHVRIDASQSVETIHRNIRMGILRLAKNDPRRYGVIGADKSIEWINERLSHQKKVN